MMSQSNISYGSSHSNLLTLSRSSSSSASSATANQYYKKFINKLGLLFKMDNHDLDSLYGKIVECVNESESFSTSDDADIAEMIHIAKNLKQSHNILKNMVEVLDNRFLKNGGEGQKPTNTKYEHQLTPIVKKQNPNNRMLDINKRQNRENAYSQMSKKSEQYQNAHTQQINVNSSLKHVTISMNEQQHGYNEEGSQTKNLAMATSTYLDNNVKWSQKQQLDNHGRVQEQNVKSSKHGDRIKKIKDEMNSIKKQLNHLADQSESSINTDPNQQSDTSLAIPTETKSQYQLRVQPLNFGKKKNKLSVKELANHRHKSNKKTKETKKQQQSLLYTQMIQETARENSRSEEQAAIQQELQQHVQASNCKKLSHQQVQRSSETLIDSLITNNHKSSYSTVETNKMNGIDKNRVNSEKMQNYMRRLEERNTKLKDYIDKIERSLSKSKKTGSTYKNNNIGSESISNQAYTKNKNPHHTPIFSMYTKSQQNNSQLEVNSKTSIREQVDIKKRRQSKHIQEYLLQEQEVWQKKQIVPKIEGFKQNNDGEQSKNLQNSSISDRLNSGSYKKYIIPMVDTNSLFKHTRDVESKVQLSEERHYRQPNEEIKRIKARVGDLFKKIKPLGQPQDEDTHKQNGNQKQFRESGVGSSRIFQQDLRQQSDQEPRISNKKSLYTDQDSKISTFIPNRSSIPTTAQMQSTNHFQRQSIESPIIRHKFSAYQQSPKNSIQNSSVRQSRQLSPSRPSNVVNPKMSVTFNPKMSFTFNTNQTMPHPQPTHQPMITYGQNLRQERQGNKRSVSFDSRKGYNSPVHPPPPPPLSRVPFSNSRIIPQKQHPPYLSPPSMIRPASSVSKVNSTGNIIHNVIPNRQVNNGEIRKRQKPNNYVGIPHRSDYLGIPHRSGYVGIPPRSENVGIPPRSENIGKPSRLEYGGIANSIVNRVQIQDERWIQRGSSRRNNIGVNRRLEQSQLSRSRSRNKRGISLCSSRKSDDH